MRALSLVVVVTSSALLLACPPNEDTREAPGRQTFASPQTNPLALSEDGSLLYVANTTSNTVSIVDTGTQAEIAEIPVGVEPVSVAVRPGGNEVWVANHVSDSVSIIDTNPASATNGTVIDTIQSRGSVQSGGVTNFDEPTNVVFASSAKAYVAISTYNQIAVVDANTREVGTPIQLTAQDPRAMTVRGGRLYVAPFESHNQTELSFCFDALNPPTFPAPDCTIDVNQIANAAANPNLAGFPINVQRDGDSPDRDLFVYSTADESQIGGVSGSITGVGTLIYGLAVSSTGDVYLANTEARNGNLAEDLVTADGNGLAAQPPNGNGDGLVDLENRLFHNRITEVDCTGATCTQGSIQRHVLDPPVGTAPAAGQALATPYGIAISDDDNLLVITAMGSSRIAALDPSTMNVIDTLDVGEMPKGVVLEPAGGGAQTAYVLNTLSNTVSVVDVSAAGALTLDTTISVGSDPTPENIRLGRIAFADADASNDGTFSCESCHPDGNIDQLLWVIGAECTFGGCNQEEPRSTMPVRGLNRTIPLHWDGTLGDPIGGPNGEVGTGGSVAANCDGSDPITCFRDLVEGALAGPMCDQDPSCAAGPSGDPGLLDDTERQNMAAFLMDITYPPARERRIDDTLSAQATQGFTDFFMDLGGNGGGDAQTCADTTGGCHDLPLGVSTNSSVVGAFEAPTMRGMYDRFINFSGGFTTSTEFLDLGPFGTGNGVIPWNVDAGFDELTNFSAGFFAFNPAYNVFPEPMFQMFEEVNTGHSGAYGRQITLNQRTLDPAKPGQLLDTVEFVDALQAADDKGLVNLRVDGWFLGGPIHLHYVGDDFYEGVPWNQSRNSMITQAQSGDGIYTLTAHLRADVGDPAHPQPLLSTDPSLPETGPTGDPNLPVVTSATTIRVRALDVRAASSILVDGEVVGGSITCVGGSFTPFCSTELVDIPIPLPTPNGVHVVQVAGEGGLLSNEFPICVGTAVDCGV